MAKLALVFALTFTAIVSFSAVVSAYRTTITTTTIEDNGAIPIYPFADGLDNRKGTKDAVASSAYKTTTTRDDNGYPFRPIYDGLDNHKVSKEQCRSQILVQQLNHCQMHLTQGIISMVSPQEQQHLQQCCSQLKTVSEQCQCDAIQQVYDQARQQGGVMEMRQMLSKAQTLPNACKLEVQDCPITSPRV